MDGWIDKTQQLYNNHITTINHVKPFPILLQFTAVLIELRTFCVFMFRFCVFFSTFRSFATFSMEQWPSG